MQNRFREMKGKRFLCFLFAFVITNSIVIWITLTSRDFYSVHKVILIPFKSYFEGFSGSRRTLLENAENIVMFVPFGFLLPHLFHTKAKRVIIAGFLFSLIIEFLQLTLGLGTFEVDDLINNTIGTAIGFGVAAGLKIKAYIYDKWGTILVASLLTAALLCLANSGHVIYMSFHQDRMVSFAALADEPGKKNLLILDGQNGYALGSKMYIEYHTDGTISITGHSDNRVWYLLGEQTLQSGTYEFTGLSGIQKETVAIELEYYDTGKEKFLRLTPDIGPVDSAEFTLTSETYIRAYVGIYPVGETFAIAKPALYRLGD